MAKKPRVESERIRRDGEKTLSLKSLSRRLRNWARESSYFDGVRSTGDVDDECKIEADLFELGISFDDGMFGESLNCYGERRTPKPPRDDDSAMPGLGASGYDDKSPNYERYVLASRAWMHANCATHKSVKAAWMDVLEEYRRGVRPPDDLIVRALMCEQKVADLTTRPKKR